MQETKPGASPPADRLGLWDAVSIIVGIVIGAGIYETAPLVLRSVGSPEEALGVWLLGGVLSLVGACCYAELATAYPRSGGDYVYLTRAFGRPVGFLFGWAQLAVILTGSIGMMAYVFADYAVAGLGAPPSSAALLAAAAVTALTALNLVSIHAGKTAQNVLTALKVAGLAAVVAAGLVLGTGGIPDADAGADPARAGTFGLAMILVLYTYGGWNDAAFVAAEVRERRDIARALLLGTALVTLVYVVVNGAFLLGLGFHEARASKAIAADLLGRALGARSAGAISALVMVSALGAVNALVFTGARLHATLGADYSALGALGRRHPRLRSPAGALLVQLGVTLALIGLVGTWPGRLVVDGALAAFGLGPATWAGHGGFDTLLRCTAPVFWTFFLLSGLSVLVLRFRDPDRERPFRVPLYPLLPLLFAGTSLFMLRAAVEYAGALWVVGAVPVLLGLPVYLASRRRPPPLAAPDSAPSRTPLDESGGRPS